MKNAFLAAWTLWLREMIRFYRQPSRILGAIGSPLIFWLLIGSGIGTSFRSSASGSRTYLDYFFPGTLLLILLFTAIFSTISIIEDRREGFLQTVLIAPIPRFSLILGKILGGATLAFAQSVLFLLLVLVIGVRLDGWHISATLALLFLNAFVLTCLGFVIAWHFNSTQGFHAVMNLFLMPIWILSGALFPIEGASGWIQAIMKINPISYGLAALRISLFGSSASSFPFSFSVLVLSLFGIFLFVLAVFSVNQKAEVSRA